MASRRSSRGHGASARRIGWSRACTSRSAGSRGRWHGSKNSAELPHPVRVSWGERQGRLSVTRPCELLGLNRSSLYYVPAGEQPLHLLRMRLLDEQCTRTPCHGPRRMTVWLRRMGSAGHRKRVQRLMRLMGLEAMYPRPHLSQGASLHESSPYVLGELEVMRPNQVWATDSTDIRMRAGFLSLVVSMDWFRRYLRSWRGSNTLEVSFCLEAREEALAHGRPAICHSDQGRQLTSQAFTSRLQHAEVRISMDSKGRGYDNIFVERWWRTEKDEEVYLQDDVAVPEAIAGIGDDFQCYNNERPHQALRYLTPAEVHVGRGRDHTLH